MKTIATLMPKPQESGFEAELVIKALSELQPKKAHIVGIFGALFPALRDAIVRGVPRKAILRELEANGVKLNAGNFKQLYDAEEQRRASGAEKEAS